MSGKGHPVLADHVLGFSILVACSIIDHDIDNLAVLFMAIDRGCDHNECFGSHEVPDASIVFASLGSAAACVQIEFEGRCEGEEERRRR